MPNAIAELHDVPEATAHAVANFVDAVLQAFGDDLRSVVLYGSGAEGRLRASSDVNLLLVYYAVYDCLRSGGVEGGMIGVNHQTTGRIE